MPNLLSPLAPAADALMAWLITYGVHSTLLLAAAALLAPRLPLPSREALWKTALVGGILTATLQMGLGLQPVAGSWSVSQVTATLPSLDQGYLEGSQWNPQAAALEALVMPQEPSTAGTTFPVSSSGIVASEMPSEASSPLTFWGTFLWALIAGLGAGSLVISYRRLLRRLSDREPVTSGLARRLLDDLLRRRPFARGILGRGISLFRSGRIGVPIAFGLREGKICVPGRALSLSEEEQESLLAHELAHVARRDPLWLLAARLLERVFFFQPLNRLARRRLQEIAEFRCDDWAAEATGRPLSLARCLTEVAGWRSAGVSTLPVAAMAVKRSGLSRRVRRLLEPSPSAKPSPWLRPLLGILLLAMVVAAPGFTGATPDAAPGAPPEPPEAPAPPEAPEPPEPPEAPEPPEDLDIEDMDVDMDIDLPDFDLPEIELPEIVIPEIVIPEIVIPHLALEGLEGLEGLDIEIPEIRIPKIEIPNVEIPEIRIPNLPAGAMNLADLDPEQQEEIRRQIERAQQEIERAQQEIQQHLGPEMERMRREIQRANEEAQRDVQREVERAMEAHRKAMEKARLHQHELSQEQREAIEKAQEEARRVLEENRQEIERAREKAREAYERERQRERQLREREKAPGVEERERRQNEEVRLQRQAMMRERTDAARARDAERRRAREEADTAGQTSESTEEP